MTLKNSLSTYEAEIYINAFKHMTI